MAMDMWEPFIASVREHLTDADDKIVFDRYHIMGYLTKAVDTVRKQENRALRGRRQDLAGTKYLWLYSVENLPERHHERFAALRAGDLKTGRAWAIKESLRHFWPYQRRGWGPSTSHAGTSGPPTPGCSRSSTRPRPSNATKRACCPTSPTGSPTPAPKASTPASRRSGSPPAATATGSTSRPPSTSTSADYSSTRPRLTHGLPGRTPFGGVGYRTTRAHRVLPGAPCR